MKGLKLAVAILALGTIAISPKADARNLFNTQQILTAQIIAQVSKSENKNTNDTNTYLERGLKRIDEEDYKGAIEDFNQVLKIEPNNAYAYVGRGLANFALEQYQAAKKDFDKALEITPNIAYAHYFRGITNYVLKDKPGAIADLRKASTLFKKEGNQEFAQKADSAIQKIQES
ncbi:tetratricopeptide repeat protein [Iningainema tapete]|uniref:Tetratricopeptide repeat protein n=1 Tax=Iningainema tapete BLCC-T55 TaxID=2748662 RepID=A0A8J6XBV2_9CYAN|nr:tetratricopeptide repeat protein [Iningainema tapete]MBD2771954.1 tetratricopeptide repeat protein [Iningainema tapete BLCC-T55]